MQHSKFGLKQLAGTWTRRATLLCAGFMLLLSQPGHTQSPLPDALNFHKNYFVTGGVVTGSVDFAPQSGSGGSISATIPMSGVPVNADIVAAFAYWETISTGPQTEIAGASFNGIDISEITKQVGHQELTATFAPCWSSGGGSNPIYTMATFRADVLRFLPIGIDSTKPGFGKRLVNSSDLEAHFPDVNDPRRFHTISLPEAGTGNQIPQTAGASLIVVFRDTRDDISPNPGLQPPPLTSVVIFDGLHVQGQGETTKQTIKGFYQAATNNPAASLTYVMGSGAKNSTERLRFTKDASDVNATVSLIESNPFVGIESPSSDRGWDGPSFPLSSLIGQSKTTVYGQQFDLLVDHTNSSPFDCLNTVAIVVASTVQDTDNDGNLDSWESVETSGALLDPNNVPLPNLYQMGARHNHKDLFVEIGRLKSDVGYDNPVQGAVDAHDHLPTETALKLVGDAFQNAPVSNPDGLPGIRAHFDVGHYYQAATSPAAAYIIPFKHADLVTPCSSPPPLPDTSDHTFDTDCLARGGEAIVETACVPNELNGGECGFPAFRGVVGWKPGFRFLRDEPLDDPTTLPDESNCAAAPNSCTRRFDRNRKDIFHYALFAHALGVQRLDDPNTQTVDESIVTTTMPVADVDPAPGIQTPVPSGVSGTGDGGGSGGGDVLVTLGFWDSFVGTDFVQASTFMHELGHNFGLRHGPPIVNQTTLLTTYQNCQPNYQSIMNYTFQIRGLTVGSNNVPLPGVQAGDVVVDFSRQLLIGVNENGLNESSALGTMNYLTAWYARVDAPLLDPLNLAGAKRHCNGTFLSPSEYTAWLQDQGMVRVDSTSRVPPINWDMDGASNETNVSQDISFNGSITSLIAGISDWSVIDLRQVGSRRNTASFAVEDAVGPLSLDQGAGDNGAGDNGAGDNGAGDNGAGDNGAGDNGAGDNGAGDNGAGDNGAGDNGAPAELDPETAEDGPHLKRPTIVKEQKPSILLSWTPPHEGTALSFDVWKSTNGSPASRIAQGLTATTYTDGDVKNKDTYIYFITALMDDPQNPGHFSRSNSQEIVF